MKQSNTSSAAPAGGQSSSIVGGAGAVGTGTGSQSSSHLGSTASNKRNTNLRGNSDNVSEADSQAKWPHDKFDEIQQQQ